MIVLPISKWRKFSGVIGTAWNPRPKTLYFASTTTGLIKIGITRNIVSRIRALDLQTDPRLGRHRVELAFHGAAEHDEKVAHKLFSRERAYLEWFYGNGLLRAFVNRMTAFELTEPVAFEEWIEPQQKRLETIKRKRKVR